MDLMTLLAKLTLDKKEYDDGLKEAEKDASNLTIAPATIPKPNNDEFKAGVQEAKDEGNLFKEVMVGVWEGVRDAIVVTGITTAIGSVVGAMRQGVSLAAKNGDEISKGAKNLQLSTKAYQEYEYVLGKSGIKVKELNTAMTTFDKIAGGNLSKKQAETFSDYFGKLGINAEEATNGMMSAEQMLTGVMDALADYKGSDKGAIIDAFFGKSDKWTGYFSQTSDEVSKLKKEAEDIGYIMSDEAVENAVAFNDASEKLAERLDAIKRSFGEGILPLITDAVNKLMMIIDFFSGSDNRNTTEKFADIDAKYKSKLSDLDINAKTAGVLADQLSKMGDTSVMDTTQLAIWKGTAQSLIDLIPSLSEVIDVENGTISANSDEIKNIIDQYTELSKATEYQIAKTEKEAELNRKQNQLTEEAVKVNNKLAEAEGHRSEALDAYNKVLEKYGHEGLGENATVGDIEKAQTEVLNSLFGDEAGYAQAFQELQSARSPLTTALNEATAAQTEVEKLTADIQSGQEAYEAWVGSEGAAYSSVQSEAQAAQSEINGITEAWNNTPNDEYTTYHIIYDDPREGSYAIGSSYIPYDQMALLHRGERVLTATENRRGEGSGGVDYGQLEERIAAAIRSGMDGATVRSYLNGKDITDQVNRNNINAVKGRRFAR